ncbi:MAG: polysaccharide deacetylase family protein [Pseudorhodoplanes sp.]|nr:polysaccharide deacetylase family protein [Pseudorhodoplanes sp.]
MLSFIAFTGLASVARANVDRPPQFIAIAFDNCTELERWQELSDFAAEMNRDGDRIHFTFFVSAVNFIASQNRNVYEGPRRPRGASSISFGGAPADVKRRVDYVNTLHAAGHEIASHAVGHFDGRSWSQAEWEKEFRSFDAVLNNIAQNNGFAADVKVAFAVSDIVGFRAPYLATSAGLYAVLKERKFRYDTSGNSAADAWPDKIDGVWRFNLARLKLANSSRATLSMDYNFFVAQSGAKADPRRQAFFRDQIVQAYLDYFRANYTGNRAPLHIGHHFFDYQGGAYKEALKTFARSVCGLPEVRCVTYKALADFMDGLSAETLADYRKGQFARAAEPAITVSELAQP